MKRIDSSLITPIYVKQHENEPLPEDPVYYLLASDHLYLCRNHANYRSCVPAPRWPTELASHAPSLSTSYPTVSAKQLERICGFFGYMSTTYRAEVIVLLAWDNIDRAIRPIVPLQVSAVGRSGLCTYPIGVKYQLPRNLPKHFQIFCDIHSHCELDAHASQTDVADEHNVNGIHIVVGRLDQEPPQFHVEAVIDGTRFRLEWTDVFSGYRKRVQFPSSWMNPVVVTNYVNFRGFDFDAIEREPVIDRSSPYPSYDL